MDSQGAEKTHVMETEFQFKLWINSWKDLTLEPVHELALPQDQRYHHGIIQMHNFEIHAGIMKISCKLKSHQASSPQSTSLQNAQHPHYTPIQSDQFLIITTRHRLKPIQLFPKQLPIHSPLPRNRNLLNFPGPNLQTQTPRHEGRSRKKCRTNRARMEQGPTTESGEKRARSVCRVPAWWSPGGGCRRRSSWAAAASPPAPGSATGSDASPSPLFSSWGASWSGGMALPASPVAAARRV